MGNRGSLTGIQQGFVVRKCMFCSGDGDTTLISAQYGSDYNWSKTEKWKCKTCSGTGEVSIEESLAQLEEVKKHGIDMGAALIVEKEEAQEYYNKLQGIICA